MKTLAHVGTALVLCGLGCSPARERDHAAAGEGGSRSSDDAGALDADARVPHMPASCAAPRLDLGACFATEDGAPPDLSNGVIAITGTVDEVTQEETECVDFVDVGINPRSYAVRVRDGELTLRFTLLLLWERPIVEVGERITVTYIERGIRGIESIPTLDSITIHDADGALVLWLAQHERGIDWLEPPEGVRILDGALRCSEEDACGTFTRSSVTVDIDGERAEMPVANVAEIGAYSVLNAENKRYDERASCELMSPGRALIAIVATERIRP